MSSHQSDDRYYSKPRRTPPAVDHQGNSFQIGQGGRTVLPPISSAFPNSHFPVPGSSYTTASYTHQRASTPGRYDYASTSTVYNHWPGSSSNPQPSPYNYYDAHDSTNRFLPTNYNTYPSRTSAGLPEDSRRLPPLSTSQPFRDDRWHGPSYTAVPANTPAMAHIRSPTASYPTSYAPYTSSGHYTYEPATSHGVPIQPLSQSSLATAIPGPRSHTPHGRSSSRGPQTSYSPPPLSPTLSEEPTVKKKRKRADAAQLKILTETYNRTAFPSTEERLELAKLLDMTPRSVQIWFQNRRQSMRQTRQSSATTSSSPQNFSMPPDPGMDDALASSSAAAYDMPPYTMQPSTSPTLTSAHRRRSQEDTVHVDPRKQQWTTRAY